MRPPSFAMSLCTASVMTLSAHAQDPHASGYHYTLPLEIAVDAGHGTFDCEDQSAGDVGGEEEAVGIDCCKLVIAL